ncbi:hypothetical protein SynWH8103_01292 [Synechococcus sp. WH 8103]|nr:hypothetical protein SynWH8103_01292 [Synechococcus sp. WH 8103]
MTGFFIALQRFSKIAAVDIRDEALIESLCLPGRARDV